MKKHLMIAGIVAAVSLGVILNNLGIWISIGIILGVAADQHFHYTN